MLSIREIEKALDVKIITSAAMSEAVGEWLNMYYDRPEWKSEKCETMGLPAAVAHEYARLATVESSFHVSGSPMAEYLDKQLNNAFKDLIEKVELYAALGGIALKPYVDDNKIIIDFVSADCFLPFNYDSNGRITGAVFVDFVLHENYIYTRLEKHTFEEHVTVKDPDGSERTTTAHTIVNKAYRSRELHDVMSIDQAITSALGMLENEIPLDQVPEWVALSEITTVSDCERPLFVYVKVPTANNIDVKSPLGASVFSRAKEAIKTCDEQYSRSKYEFEAFEAAIDATDDLFRKNKKGETILPTGKERIFRTYPKPMGDEKNSSFINAFAPEIRDASLFNGLNEYLRTVEYLTDLSFGTFSEVRNTIKTVQEAISSKQRSFTAVKSIQTAWDEAIRDLIYCMWALSVLYELAPVGLYECSIMWGDGILEDIEKEYQRRFMLVQAGKLKPELLLSWYFGCSEEEARKMIPEDQAKI